MRHLWSLVAGLAITPIAWVLIALGQNALITTDDSQLYLGGLIIVGVGLLLGLVGTLRTSPLGAMLAAVTYLGCYLYLLVSTKDALDFFTTHWKIGDYSINLAGPLTTSVLPVVGGMMLLAAFSPSRWRAWPKPEDPNASLWPTPPPPWTPPAPVKAEPMRFDEPPTVVDEQNKLG